MRKEVRKVKPVPIFLDNPVDRDSLGVSELAYTIAGAAIGNPGPLTIGVFGGWGQGKTSVLRISRELLRGDTYEHPVATVWFNAWQHEREEHPLFSLIAAIVDGLEKESDRLTKAEPDSVHSKAKEGFRKAALSLRALTRGMKFTGKVGVPLLGEVGVEFDAKQALDAEELLGKQNHPLLGELLYHQAFEGLGEVTAQFQKEMAKSKKGTHANVVVFIDDLDRCNPERALHLLEGIKLILSQPGFVFVMGIDRNVIEKYLAYVYEEKYKVKDEERGRRYLDKLVQLPLNLPSHRSVMDDHVLKLLEDFEKRVTGSRELEQLLRIVQSSQGAIVAGARGNPRSLVRLLNGFMVDCQLWGDIREFPLVEIAGALIFYRLLESRFSDGELGAVVSNDEFWRIICNEGAEAVLKREDIESQKKTDFRGRFVIEQRVATAIARSDELQELLKGNAKLYGESQVLRKRIESVASQQARARFQVILPENLIAAIRRSMNVVVDLDITKGVIDNVVALECSFDNIGDNEMKIIGEHFKNLHSLDLSYSNATDKGIMIIADQLKKLEWLDLGLTRVTDEGVKAVADHLKSLSWLGLGNTSITDEGIKCLAKKLPNLVGLDISLTSTTDEGIGSK